MIKGFVVMFLPALTMMFVVVWFEFFEISFDPIKLFSGCLGTMFISMPLGFKISA